MPNFTHGKSAAFSLDNAAGVLTDISEYADNVDFQFQVDNAEVTTFGKASRVYVPGLKGTTINVSGAWDPTVDAMMVAALGAEKSFAYGPGGSGNGAVKYSGECICTSYSPPSSIGSANTWSASFQVTGDVGIGTY